MQKAVLIASGPAEDLNVTTNTQPAMLAGDVQLMVGNYGVFRGAHEGGRVGPGGGYAECIPN